MDKSFVATHTGRVRRDDPRWSRTKLEYYHVNLMRHGANWITEGGTVFGAATGKPKRGNDRHLQTFTIKPIEPE